MWSVDDSVSIGCNQGIGFNRQQLATTMGPAIHPAPPVSSTPIMYRYPRARSSISTSSRDSRLSCFIFCFVFGCRVDTRFPSLSWVANIRDIRHCLVLLSRRHAVPAGDDDDDDDADRLKTWYAAVTAGRVQDINRILPYITEGAVAGRGAWMGWTLSVVSDGDYCILHVWWSRSPVFNVQCSMFLSLIVTCCYDTRFSSAGAHRTSKMLDQFSTLFEAVWRISFVRTSCRHDSRFKIYLTISLNRLPNCSHGRMEI